MSGIHDRTSVGAPPISNSVDAPPVERRRSASIAGHRVTQEPPDDATRARASSSPPVLCSADAPKSNAAASDAFVAALGAEKLNQDKSRKDKSSRESNDNNATLNDEGYSTVGRSARELVADMGRAFEKDRKAIRECLAAGNETSTNAATERAAELYGRTLNLKRILDRYCADRPVRRLTDLPLDEMHAVYRLGEIVSDNLKALNRLQERLSSAEHWFAEDIRAMGVKQNEMLAKNLKEFFLGAVKIGADFLAEKQDRLIGRLAVLLNVAPETLAKVAAEGLGYADAADCLKRFALQRLESLHQDAKSLMTIGANATGQGAWDLVGRIEKSYGQPLCDRTKMQGMPPDAKTVATWVDAKYREAGAEIEWAMNDARDASHLLDLLHWEFIAQLAQNIEARLAIGEKVVGLDALLQNTDYLPSFVSTSDRKKFVAALEKSAAQIALSSFDNLRNPERGRTGGFGTVMAGTLITPSVEKEVVVKRQSIGPRASGSRREKLRDVINEAVVQARFNADPHVPKIEGAFVFEDEHFTVMEKVHGPTMSDLISEHAGMSEDDRRRIGMHFVVGAVDALADMAEEGAIHRDIKPNNLMLDERNLRVYLIDFGAAGPANKLPPATYATTFGSREHLNLKGESTPQTDVISMGSLVYKVLGGRLWDAPEGISNKDQPWEGGRGTTRFANPGRFDEKDADAVDIWTKPGMPEAKRFVEACWHKDPLARPTALQMRQAIRGESVTPAPANGPGIKGSQTDVDAVFAVLRPDHPFRKGTLEAFRRVCGSDPTDSKQQSPTRRVRAAPADADSLPKTTRNAAEARAINNNNVSADSSSGLSGEVDDSFEEKREHQLCEAIGNVIDTSPSVVAYELEEMKTNEAIGHDRSGIARLLDDYAKKVVAKDFAAAQKILSGKTRDSEAEVNVFRKLIQNGASQFELEEYQRHLFDWIDGLLRIYLEEE